MGRTPAPSISEVRTRLQGMGRDRTGRSSHTTAWPWEGRPSAAETLPMPHPPGQVLLGPPGRAWGDFCTREPSGRQRSRTPCSPGDS